MIALEGALRRRGHRVARNDGAGADVHVIQSVWFDRAAFDRTREPGSVVLHRVDGPIRLYRGDDEASDALCYAINREIADATVMQSGWSLEKTYDLGFQPVRPVLMWNACDPGIFNREGRAPFDRARKTRLISTSWSDNPRKGRDTYQWLDEHLDWGRYEYTFVGRIRETFRNIRTMEPVDSETLAGLLKRHDIFITASRNDPCSNALVEALSCGLPAVYFDDGGHPELVEFGGLGFRAAEEIPGRLDRVADRYESFQDNIWVDRIDDLADRYVELARQVLDEG
jgi:glycosyltransferase involved in cell wall biosynthesis